VDAGTLGRFDIGHETRFADASRTEQLGANEAPSIGYRRPAEADRRAERLSVRPALPT
jgi:hypothetical protein